MGHPYRQPWYSEMGQENVWGGGVKKREAKKGEEIPPEALEKLIWKLR